MGVRKNSVGESISEKHNFTTIENESSVNKNAVGDKLSAIRTLYETRA